MKYVLRCFILCLAIFSFSLPVFAENTQAISVAQAEVAKGEAININSADAQTMANAKLKGIGKKRAEAIVAYRGQHGPFKSIDDLKNVKGISEKIIDANRTKLTVG